MAAISAFSRSISAVSVARFLNSPIARSSPYPTGAPEAADGFGSRSAGYRSAMSTTVARKVYEFNKAVMSASVTTTRTVVGAVGSGVSSAVKTLRDSGATVVGQTRSAADRTMEQASTGAKEVAGQARAQGERASSRLDGIADRTARRATAAVDDSPSSGTPYEQWTKSELYERAQELDIEGRSGMSKAQLIAALRGH